MSEAAATEPVVEAPAEEAIAPEDNPADIYAGMFRDDGDEPAPAKEEKPKEEPVAEAAPAAETVEEQPKEEPEPPKVEPKREELALAKAERDLRQASADLVSEKKARTTAEQKLTALEAKIKGNWIKAAEEATGKPFHELMELAAKGEFDEKPAHAKPELDDETKEVIAWAKQEKQARAEKAAADAKLAEKNKNAPVIKAFLDGVGEDYPLITSMPNAQQAVLDLAFEELESTGRQPDLHKIAEELNREAAQYADVYFTNDKLLAAVLKDPKRLAAVKALVAPVAPAPAAKTPAAAAPASGRLAAPAEVVARTAKADADDEEAERIAHIKALRSHQERAN